MPPTGVKATANVAANTVQLTWQPIANGVGYVVERADATDGPFYQFSGKLTTTSYTDTRVFSGQTYHYRVLAVDDNGMISRPADQAAGQYPAQASVIMLQRQ
jgi:fibronectin type 3 domain-containing protein